MWAREYARQICIDQSDSSSSESGESDHEECIELRRAYYYSDLDWLGLEESAANDRSINNLMDGSNERG